ncbi:MAG: hypothetical protein KBC96_05840 [Armatimonadetes bacterium]|nr:hypothetical protein [Armatimonadota bacterium]
MAYCKWCGMESKTDRKCEWCGRDLVAAPAAAGPPPARDHVAEFEDENRGLRTAFYISSAGILILSVVLTGWRFLLLPWIAVGALFVTGMLLGALRILPAIEDEWHEFVIPLVLVLVAGPELVFVGYLIYGLVTREMDLTVIWLLASYFGMLLLIEIMALVLIAAGIGPERLPMMFMFQIRAAAVLGMVAIIFGWGASGLFRRMDR